MGSSRNLTKQAHDGACQLRRGGDAEVQMIVGGATRARVGHDLGPGKARTRFRSGRARTHENRVRFRIEVSNRFIQMVCDGKLGYGCQQVCDTPSAPCIPFEDHDARSKDQLGHHVSPTLVPG